MASFLPSGVPKSGAAAITAPKETSKPSYQTLEQEGLRYWGNQEQEGSVFGATKNRKPITSTQTRPTTEDPAPHEFWFLLLETCMSTISSYDVHLHSNLIK